MIHICHARECKTSVPPKMFMCGKHWGMVPKDMQMEVWGAYVEGQEKRKDPSEHYMEVATKVIDHVANLEGRAI